MVQFDAEHRLTCMQIPLSLSLPLPWRGPADALIADELQRRGCKAHDLSLEQVAPLVEQLLSHTQDCLQAGISAGGTLVRDLAEAIMMCW